MISKNTKAQLAQYVYMMRIFPVPTLEQARRRGAGLQTRKTPTLLSGAYGLELLW